MLDPRLIPFQSPGIASNLSNAAQRSTLSGDDESKWEGALSHHLNNHYSESCTARSFHNPSHLPGDYGNDALPLFQLPLDISEHLEQIQMMQTDNNIYKYGIGSILDC